MTSLSFAPHPGARPLPSRVLSYARIETRLTLRNAEQFVLALVIPVIVLFAGDEATSVVDLGAGRRIDVLTPGVFSLAVMSTAFTSLAIQTGFERRYGVLKRLGATPLSRTALVAGKVVSLLVVECLQLAVLVAAALLLGWQPRGGLPDVPAVALLLVLGTAAFAAAALALAGTLRAELTLAAANLLYLVLVVAGAVLLPLSSYPGWAREVVALLPSGALAEGLREVLSGDGLDWFRVLVLAVWAAAATAVATRRFRWE